MDWVLSKESRLAAGKLTDLMVGRCYTHECTTCQALSLPQLLCDISRQVVDKYVFNEWVREWVSKCMNA